MMRAKSTTTGPLDLHVRELLRREETDTELERDMVNGSDTISLVLNFALTEVLVPQWGALTE